MHSKAEVLKYITLKFFYKQSLSYCDINFLKMSHFGGVGPPNIYIISKVPEKIIIFYCLSFEILSNTIDFNIYVLIFFNLFLNFKFFIYQCKYLSKL